MQTIDYLNRHPLLSHSSHIARDILSVLLCNQKAFFAVEFHATVDPETTAN